MEDATLTAAVSIFQSDNEYTSSTKGAEIQALDDWRSSINIPDDYASYREDIDDMFEPFKSMWDGHFGHITSATHRVVLDPPATMPTHFVPYRAGQKARDFKRNEVENML